LDIDRYTVSSRFPVFASMQETAPARAFLDALGSHHSVPTHEVPAARDAGDAVVLEHPLNLERVFSGDLQSQLAGAKAALSEAESRHQSVLATTAEKLADQKAAYELALARNAAIWEMVEEQLREAALGVERARQGQASAVDAADRAKHRASELEAEIAGEVEARRELEQAVARAAQEHENAEAQHASAMAAAAARADDLAAVLRRANEESESRAAEIQRLVDQKADLTSQLALAETGRAAIERQLQVTQTAVHEADARATRERLAAYQKAAEREADLDGQLRLERDARDEVERAAADAAAVAREELERQQQTLAAATSQLAELRGRFEHELSDATSARDAAAERLTSTEAALDQLRHDHASEKAESDRSRQQREADLEGQLRLERDARAEVERAAADAAVVAREELERQRQALAAATSELAELRGRFEHELSEATSARDTAAERLTSTEAALDQLRRDHASELAESARSRQQREAELMERVSEQQAAIEASERRIAETATAIEDAGRREAVLREKLQQEREARSRLETDLSTLQQGVASVQERASRLQSERNILSDELDAAMRKLGAAESKLEKVEREASQVPRLRQRIELAHRMEAVGRLASEAAGTCGNLLADVHQNVQQWLMASTGDMGVRQRGELVLDDVTRAAGLVRQLSGYVDENGRAPGEVDLIAIIRDLEPVLRRVAGQDVELRLPTDIATLRLGLSSERVDRLLVNLASYGRERMPEGGRATIELANVDVDRESAARHTNLRTGAYALITMTKSRTKDDEQAQNSTVQRSRGRSGRTPGVELGTLQAQVGECGGHLWMTINPQGDIVSKLYLPLPGNA
jgi:chromosome segregation ATPase